MSRDFSTPYWLLRNWSVILERKANPYHAGHSVHHDRQHLCPERSLSQNHAVEDLLAVDSCVILRRAARQGRRALPLANQVGLVVPGQPLRGNECGSGLILEDSTIDGHYFPP